MSVQFSSVAQSVVSDSLQPHELQHARPPCPSPTPEFTQTHVHQVGDAIQPSHPLSSPSPPASSPSHHQSFLMSQLFTWGDQSILLYISILNFMSLKIVYLFFEVLLNINILSKLTIATNDFISSGCTYLEHSIVMFLFLIYNTL